MAIPLRVLIIEDSDSDAALNVRVLETAGYKVTHEIVTTAKEMKAALHTQTFGLIIADHSLPQFDSLKALALLKESEQDIPFIIVSGSIGEETAVKAMKAGAQDYIMKGNLSRLGAAVERELQDTGVRRERKLAEEALKASESLLETAIRILPLGLWIIDAKGRITVSSDAAQRTWHGVRYVGIDQLGEYKGWRTDTGKLMEAHEWAGARALEKGETTIEEEVEIECFDGTHKFILDSAAPIRTSNGSICGAVTINQDITECKQLEKKLKEINDDLMRSNRDLEQFAYVASHDLQEPLRMISSYTQLLAERYKGQLDEKADKYIAYAVDGAVRMQQLINDLLAYSRIGTKKAPPEPVDTHAALGEALRNLSVTITENSAIITNGDLPVVQVDPMQVVQLFQNLISNAVKFHGDKLPLIHVSAVESEHEWLFSVEDNGIGIDHEYKDKLFIIFKRLHTRMEYPGTGIGLALCKHIVERHRGRIWFESEPATGSTFYFTLPKF